MEGRGEGVFAPEDGITRSETAAIFYRCLTDACRDGLTGPRSFWDVSPRAWYFEAVTALAGAGVLSGREDSGFDPDSGITRGEFVTVAARVLGLEALSGPDLFTDTGGSWVRESINAAAAAGLIGGYPDGSLRPDAPITRAEAAAILNGVLGRDAGSVRPRAVSPLVGRPRLRLVLRRRPPRHPDLKHTQDKR